MNSLLSLQRDAQSRAGNGWAALGILRVAVTIQKSSFYSDMKPQVSDLICWVKEILDGEFAALVTLALL